LAQRRVVESLKKEQVPTEKRGLKDNGYYCGVLTLSQKERNRRLQHGYHVGLLLKKQQKLSLSFHQDSSKHIRRLSLWEIKGTELDHRLNEMDEWLRESTPITDLVLPEIKSVPTAKQLT
jgi:hypothetical protein